MKYLWQAYDETKIYNVPRKLVEPYSEVQDDDGQRVMVSPFFRFETIFSALIEAWQDESIDENVIKEIENIVYHYLAHLDRVAGLRFCFIVEALIEKELLQGSCGMQVKEQYERLTTAEKRQLLYFLREKKLRRNKKSFFCQVVTKFFGPVQMYYYGYEKKFFLCIPARKTDERSSKLELIQDLFFDVTGELEVFWDTDIGFIGREETMKIGQVIMY